jgi:hypothetical protein
MSSPRLLIAMLLSLSPSLAACDDGSSEDADASVEDVDAATATIVFSVQVVDALEKELTPLPGIEVCVAERPEVECATSDAEGRLTIELPADSELMLRCEGDDYGPAYMTWTIGEKDIDAGTFSLIDQTRMPFFVSLSGGTEWPDKGAIAVNVYDDLEDRTRRVAGATFSIAPSGGGGPTYVGTEQLPDQELTESTEGGPALFYDLDDGEVTITIAHPSSTCRGGFGWHNDEPTELRSQIFAGGLSFITFVCPAE